MPSFPKINVSRGILYIPPINLTIMLEIAIMSAPVTKLFDFCDNLYHTFRLFGNTEYFSYYTLLYYLRSSQNAKKINFIAKK